MISNTRKVMGSFLKSRRERLSPKDVNLPIPQGQRRTPGLRREEVALLAGVSVTYYTWLEQGRELTPSRSVIDSIARALQLSPDEEQHLIQLWDSHTSETPDQELAMSFSQMQKMIDQLEDPAHITNERTEILAWNKAAKEKLTDFSAIPIQERYFIELLMEDDVLRRRILNIEEFTSYSVAVFRTYYDKHRDDPWFDETVNHLIQSNTEFERLWKQYDVQGKKVNRLTLQMDDTNSLTTYDMHSLVNMPGNANVHICIYTPVSDQIVADG
ncbi:helix-turn-helix transcriptional regulator [Aureibacillus halotolerans]|uniref:Helix-turn-helix protein n=1 Tax=Aureibacillus halotolerans TaxID=1508390 RepID=A0A4R6U7X9_9BACI|nr:helix-turn-helix transcriptional regulator [Aureibacillus halotolerans]TDQ42650.1 helix-turn-helix protein [Aureibacillus halotolerans]